MDVRYGYLGFSVAKRGGANTIFYLTGGPIVGSDGVRVRGKATSAKGEAKGLEHLHLVTYVTTLTFAQLPDTNQPLCCTWYLRGS